MISRRGFVLGISLFSVPVVSGVAQRRARRPRIDWSVVRFVVLLGEVRDGTGYPHPRLRQVVRDTLSAQLGALAGLLFFVDEIPANIMTEARRRRVRVVRLDTTLQQVATSYPREREVSVRAVVSIVLAENPGNRLVAGAEGAGSRSDRSLSLTTEQMEGQLIDGAVESATDTALQEVVRSYFTR